MRSIAEERREGTFELLATRPLTHLQIILGKYTGGGNNRAVCPAAYAGLLLFGVYTLERYTEVMLIPGAVIGSYIGLFLLGGAFAAIGLFCLSSNLATDHRFYHRAYLSASSSTAGLIR